MEYILNSGCRFHYGDVPEAFQKGYDDREWQQVILPHDWAVTMPFNKSCSSGTGYLEGGIGWYRIPFTLTAESQDKKIHICFDGIYKHAKVWCNGYYLGSWANGHTAFSFDITHAVSCDNSQNVIAVKVEHEDIADSRWYNGSGINKRVSIRIQDKVYSNPESAAFKVTQLDHNKAQLQVTQNIYNDTENDVMAIVINCLWNQEHDEIAAKETTQVQIKAGKSAQVEQFFTVSNPILWSDRNPYLYQWKSEITASAQGQELEDCFSQRVGIRTFTFDPDTGFFINGENKKLKGVCLHEDAGCFGTAVPGNVWRRRLTLLKEMGANTIRMSHNPHAAELYDLCDEMGFYVIDEIFDEWEGPKNKWSVGHNVYPPKHQGYYEDYPQWHEKDIASFVRANRNRPSVIMWSIGNEIDYPNDPYCHPSFQTMTGNNDNKKPEAERMYNADRPNSERLSVIAAHLAELVRREDVTRPVSLASAFPELSANIGLYDALDVIGYNYKEHLYEADHKRFPCQPILGSENGHGLEQWKAVTEHAYISGQCLWTGIDYLGETSGWPQHGSEAGILTTAGFKKANYDFRKALWSDKPFTAIVTGRGEVIGNHYNYEASWNYCRNEKVNIKIFTNEDEVTLLLNGEKQAVLKRVDMEVPMYELEFEPGRIEAIGRHSRAAIETVYAASQIALKGWDKELRADGTSIYQIEVTMQDEKGRTVTGEERELFVTVTGEGVLAGIDNGNLRDTTDYKAVYRRPFAGRMMIYVRSTNTPGAVTVTVSGKYGLKNALTLQTCRGNGTSNA